MYLNRFRKAANGWKHANAERDHLRKTLPYVVSWYCGFIRHFRLLVSPLCKRIGSTPTTAGVFQDLADKVQKNNTGKTQYFIIVSREYP